MEQNVQPSVLGLEGVADGLAVRVGGTFQINRADGRTRQSQRLDFVVHRLQPAHRATGEDHVRAVPGEGQGDDPPYAGPGPGQQSHPTGEQVGGGPVAGGRAVSGGAVVGSDHGSARCRSVSAGGRVSSTSG